METAVPEEVRNRLPARKSLPGVSPADSTMDSGYSSMSSHPSQRSHNSNVEDLPESDCSKEPPLNFKKQSARNINSNHGDLPESDCSKEPPLNFKKQFLRSHNSNVEDLPESDCSKEPPLNFKKQSARNRNSNHGDLPESDCSKEPPLNFKKQILRNQNSNHENMPESDCSKEPPLNFKKQSVRQKSHSLGKSNATQTPPTEKRSEAPVWQNVLILAALAAALYIVFHLCSKDSLVNQNVTIVLLGNTGSGKSATGNSILGRKAFKVDASPVSVTTHCEKQSGVYGDTRISVIDTPGLTDEMRAKVTECVDILEPHILVLVVRLGRFTEEERNAVQWIQNSFGKRAPSFTTVVFTHLDQLKGKSVESFLSSSPDVQRLISSFGGGYHAIDNVHRNDEQVKQLLKKIDALCHKTWGHTFTKKIQEKIIRTVEEKKMEEGNTQLKEESEKIVCAKNQAEDAIDQADDAHKQTSAASQQLKEEQQKRIDAEKQAKDARDQADNAHKQANHTSQQLKEEQDKRIQAEKQAEDARKQANDAIKKAYEAHEQLKMEMEKRNLAEKQVENARKWAEHADKRANDAATQLEERLERIMGLKQQIEDAQKRTEHTEKWANEASGQLKERWERVIHAERQAEDARKQANYADKLTNEASRQLKEEEMVDEVIQEIDATEQVDKAEFSVLLFVVKLIVIAFVLIFMIALCADYAMTH